VLRKQPPGELLPSAHQVDREYRVMHALRDSDVPVPKMYALCEDASVIGTKFYVMEKVAGRVFTDLLLPSMNNAERRAVYEDLARVLAALHRVDHRAVGLESFGKPGNYYSRQISRWSKQYVASQTESLPAMDKLMQWLPEHTPQADETVITATIGWVNADPSDAAANRRRARLGTVDPAIRWPIWVTSAWTTTDSYTAGLARPISRTSAFRPNASSSRTIAGSPDAARSTTGSSTWCTTCSGQPPSFRRLQAASTVTRAPIPRSVSRTRAGCARTGRGRWSTRNSLSAPRSGRLRGGDRRRCWCVHSVVGEDAHVAQFHESVHAGMQRWDAVFLAQLRSDPALVIEAFEFDANDRSRRIDMRDSRRGRRLRARL
jgi:hypothetical protein